MTLAFPRIKVLANSLSRTLGVLAISGSIFVQMPVTQAEAAPERYAAIVMDANSGKVLFGKNQDDKRYPASLTKMMTLYMLFDALESGRASLSTSMKVSAYAAGRPPTRLGVKTGSTLSVEEAIMGLITRSANDASVVVAEFLGGTESQFADMMTTKARKLGMSRTTFQNANGLPNPSQTTTARDMATLGIALREHFPQYYRYFGTRSFKFRGQTISGHNRLMGRMEGVDGIKTGYINASGFNLVTSIVRGNKKLVAVVMGGRTARSRDDHMADLLSKYLPEASSRGGDPLVASYSPAARGPAVASHVASLPESVPLPTRRAASINERVAQAYGSNAAGAMNAITAPTGRPVIGREALRAALGNRNPRPAMEVPVANALAPTGPVPRASVPNAGRIEIASAATSHGGATSPWVVQIAATPVEATALEMLAEAKQRAGSVLARAHAFTEAVDSGSQTLYRARFAGFDSKAQANAACQALKDRAYACYAIANN